MKLSSKYDIGDIVKFGSQDFPAVGIIERITIKGEGKIVYRMKEYSAYISESVILCRLVDEVV